MAWNRLKAGEDVEGHPEHRHRFSRLCGGCCVAFCTCFIFLVIVLGLAVLIAWLALDRPKSSHYSIVSASVPTLTVAGDTNSLLSNSQINAVFTYGLEARNPNKRVTLEYEKFNVKTSYLGVDIGYSSVPGLRVGKRSSEIVTVTTSGGAVGVSNIVGSALKADINRGSVTVKVRIDTRVKAHIGDYTSFWIWLHTDCHVTVSTPNGGTPGTLLSSKCDMSN